MPMSREQLLQVQASARIYQARADDAFQSWGMRAPAPVIGEDPEDYRRRLMIRAKKQLPEGHELRQVTVNQLPAETLNIYEPMFYDACKKAGNTADSAAPNGLRMVERINPANGQRMIEFLGTRSFVHDFKSPVRRVVSFRTHQGAVDASGRFLR
jgi:hypothetical protein